MLYILLLTQFIAHIFADFYCQTDKFCNLKEQDGLRSWQIYTHGGIVFLISWLLSLSVDFWWMALCFGIVHLILDTIKIGYKDIPYAFFIDQMFHVTIIIVGCISYYKLCSYTPCFIINTYYLLITIGILLCIKPANIIIRELFRSLELTAITPDKKEELPNAGKTIGIFERLLAFLFVIIGQYEALGFLIAAKSLLRFRDSDTAKTEYVLVGTLLSFFIAITLGILTITLQTIM